MQCNEFTVRQESISTEVLSIDGRFCNPGWYIMNMCFQNYYDQGNRNE